MKFVQNFILLFPETDDSQQKDRASFDFVTNATIALCCSTSCLAPPSSFSALRSNAFISRAARLCAWDNLANSSIDCGVAPSF